MMYGWLVKTHDRKFFMREREKLSSLHFLHAMMLIGSYMPLYIWQSSNGSYPMTVATMAS